MCKFKSFILFKDQILHSIKTDSHEDILAEHGISDDRADPKFVRVEFIPPETGARDLANWEFIVDQDIRPDWFDETEQRARVEEFSRHSVIGVQIFFEGRHEVKDGKFTARENSSVVARGNSSVVARGNSSVEAWEKSSVVAWEKSSVEAWGNSSVVAREKSSVEAWGNSSVVARENSSVVAREKSSVEAWEKSSVEAWGNSSVEAWGNSVTQIREAWYEKARVTIKSVNDDSVILNTVTHEITTATEWTVKKFEAPQE